MADYTITFARSARKELEAMDTGIVLRIFPKIEALAREPRPAALSQTAGRTVLVADSDRRLSRGLCGV